MATHSKLGASAAKRWMNCPGSIRLINALPPEEKDTESPYAREGTEAHNVAEQALNEGGDCWMYTDVPDMVTATQVYVDYVRSILEAHPFAEMYTEVRFHLDHIDASMYGTADCVIFDGKSQTLWVLDYKHGQGVYVGAEGNVQLQYYALGALYHLGLYDAPINVVVGIVQPRFRGEDPIRTWGIDSEYLTGEFEDRLAKAVAATKEPKAPLACGEWCQFCPAKGSCPAQANDMQQYAVELFQDIPVESGLPSPDTLTPEQISVFLDAEKQFTQWFAAVREHAFHMAKEQGQSIPKYEIVPGRKSRKWRDEAQVRAAFEELYGQRLYSEPKLKTPAQLEKIVGKKEVEPLVEVTQGVSLKRVDETKIEIAVAAFLDADKGV